MKRDTSMPRLAAANDHDGILPGYVVMKSYLPDASRQPEPVARCTSPVALFHPARSDGGRYCDRPMDWSTRVVGLAGTCAIFGLVLAAALFTWHAVHTPVASTSRPLTVMELAPLEAPPEPVKDVAPGPEQVERQEAKPKPVSEVVPQPLIQLPIPSPSVRETSEPVELVDPGPPVPQTTAPKSIAAPSANRLANDAKPNWEGQLLAHLERFRRYPARARAARQQGVATIRFTMNRAGMVLSSAVVRSSGVSALDTAALDTLKRAQPLPEIPADRPDTVELTIPVEFYLH
ncbi:energy transducer TonB [Sphingobium aquiterrae]|uniref:energy transducer TonB family protein n=1 Tax=Sphingobium aquiterrae TaxID=2038656 RepID=UPI003016FA7C